MLALHGRWRAIDHLCDRRDLCRQEPLRAFRFIKVSSLRTAELATLATLVDFARGPGYVLNFSDREFSQFFGRELGVNIDDPKYSLEGGSKGKRLRTFLGATDDATAARTLKALWSAREELLLSTGQPDPVAQAQVRYSKLLNRLIGSLVSKVSEPIAAQPIYENLKAELMALAPLLPHPRGYAFQKFLYRLFEAHGTDPRKSFRNRGEEIDGSFSLCGNDYLLEAKWEARQTGAADLRAFEGKIAEKAPWTRGLFVSYVGFSLDGLAAFGRAKRTLCMDGLDLYDMLDQKLSLDRVLEAKARKASETGTPFAKVRELF